jgi:glucan phosphoethanolaminetransferase (alkaline phosphatase superfamily)
VADPMFPEPMPPIGGSAKPPVKPKVPKEVTISFVVWVLSMVVSSVLQLVDVNVFVEAFQKQMANQPADTQLSAGTLKGIAIFVIVAVGLVMLLFAWKMREGRNWARIVLTVLGLISLYVQARTVGMASPMALLGVVVTATGLVFMFMPPANAYFAEVRKQQLQRRR